VAAILLVYTPLKRLSKVHNGFQQIRTVFERLKDLTLAQMERSGGIVHAIRGKISFRSVSFKYPGNEEYVLKGIELEIREGEIIALVGYSGAGKTTLVDLVSGFYEPTEGKILIDGIDIRDIDLKSLRAAIGLVSQEVVLFDDTVRANILMGRPTATMDEVIEAAKAAYAHEFIMQLPEGYETKIGEHGARLSGGQRQRITIARAILRDPKILLLDEATSSLDTESEQKVQQALEALMKGRTTIVIAHRLSTVQLAHRIVVLNKGIIEQSGTHEELLLAGGLYRELYNLQMTK
jgi:subfamily B ATP-binding cassette protein MsbA